MKILLALFGVLLTYGAFSQDSTFVDNRDGQVYELLHFGSTTWFGSNLKLVTESSWCFDEKNQDECLHGNYYFNYELDSICPVDWHVSTWEDWENAMPYILESLEADSTSIKKYDHGSRGTYFDGAALLNDSLGLKLHPTSWIQGKKKAKNRGAADIWVLDSLDSKVHLHIGPVAYTLHSHNKNVIGKPRRVRRFAVRCVKNNTQGE